MLVDCAIIGGGPAGLNAALVLGRARRKVILFDDNSPRNAVTQESHGFITRDGIKPGEFRDLAYRDIDKYASVEIRRETITEAKRQTASFELMNETGEVFQSRTLLLAAGLKDILPSVAGIHDFYGKSLFSCPYCDGWELRDKALTVISENQHALHMVKTVYNWSKDLMLCTNGAQILTPEQKERLRQKGIAVYEQKISSLIGENGFLEKIAFEDGFETARSGGFVTPEWRQSSGIGALLGCEMSEIGGFVTDGFGRTNVDGVYAAGDTSVIAPAQLIIAAAGGSRAAIGINTDLTQRDFGD